MVDTLTAPPARAGAVPPPPAAAILCRGLTKRFGSLVAVDGLELTVPRGEFFGLLGPNGAGKTTTVGMLTTRVVPSAGSAVVDGVDVVASPALARTRLAAVTQTNTLDRSLTVWDNLYFHGRYFNLGTAESRRRADELLERFRLADRARSQVMALSGGMAQRLQIARALVHEPAVLFLDEPTAGLDPQSRLALWDELRAVRERGQTILLTTHQMEEADTLCDRVAIMDHGRIVALDTPAGLKASVGAARIATLILAGAAGPLRERLAAVQGVTDVRVEAHVARVYASRTAGLVGDLVNTVAAAGAEVTDLSVAETSLETVFLTLTGRELRE